MKIIKLPIGKIQHSGLDLTDSVENEWLCLKILAAYNLPVSQAKIALFEDIKTLVVERFDRKWANHDTSLLRLPQEDMCQALGIFSDLKYESDGGPGGTYNPRADRSTFMKAVFLFWVLGAIDGHAKNFSIFLEAGGRYRLTPIYDVMSAYPLLAKGQMTKQKLKMAMSLKSKNRHYHWHEIQLRHWLSMAEICQFDTAEMQSIIDTMETAISQVTEQLPKNFPQYISQAIFNNMRKLKLHVRSQLT
jgi:serine/threonine-protein kinase HipA